MLLHAAGLAATFCGNQRGGHDAARWIRLFHRGFFVALGCTGAFTREAVAQSFPTRAVRYIMPLPAGSETDVFGRTLSRQLGDM